MRASRMVADSTRIDPVTLAASAAADGEDDELDALFDVNVKAPFRLIQAALPALRPQPQDRTPSP